MGCEIADGGCCFRPVINSNGIVDGPDAEGNRIDGYVSETFLLYELALPFAIPISHTPFDEFILPVPKSMWLEIGHKLVIKDIAVSQEKGQNRTPKFVMQGEGNV